MGDSSMTTLLFPGQGSQTPDMRETVERHRPDLLELALREVGDDLFERAGEGTLIHLSKGLVMAPLEANGRERVC